MISEALKRVEVDRPQSDKRRFLSRMDHIAKEKEELVKQLGKAIAEAEAFCSERQVDLKAESTRRNWAKTSAPESNKPSQKAEQAARRSKTGLWSDPAAIPPSEYRAKKNPAPKTGEHRLNTSSNVGHNSTCKYFQKSKRGLPCGPDEGKPGGICGGQRASRAAFSIPAGIRVAFLNADIRIVRPTLTTCATTSFNRPSRRDRMRRREPTMNSDDAGIYFKC